MINKFFTLFLCASVLAFTSCSSDDDTVTNSGPIDILIEGASISPQIGGPNEQNQVYVDLSTNTTTSVQRDTWDLGFYSGSDFRVAINGSMAMAVAELSTTNIDAVSSTDTEVTNLQPQVGVGTFDSANMVYVDAPNGDISGTAINEISDNDSENNVYLLNLGKEIGTGTPENGSQDLGNVDRGWMKIRILKNENEYILQYADLDATTHQQVTISKNTDFNFTFFSLNTNSEVNIEPSKANWDLNFTTFTSEVFMGPDSYGAYFFGDFVVHNRKGNVSTYMIDSEVNTELTYDNFTFQDVVNTNFSNDQRTIGSSWRNTTPGQPVGHFENVFYIVNDTDGNFYKLKFLALTNNAGERGHPQFVYSLLQ